MSRYFNDNSSFRRSKQRDDIDPMASMGNMGDIMLVFACGLMVALVMAWNVDLDRFQQVDMKQEISPDNIEQITEQLYGEGGAFVERGRVYQDPTTGKYYLVEETPSSNGTAGTSGTSDSSSSTGSSGNDAGSSGSASGAGSN